MDHKTLIDRVLQGYGDPGTTIVPPVLTQWHVEPDHLRTFDIELAKQKLDAAGYPLDASGKRLDKEGKVINLRMFMPDSDENYPKAAQFIADWYGQLGIKVTTQVLSSATLGEHHLPPEAGEGYTADYDIELWGWSGGVDPNGLLQVFKCDAIGSSSDSQYCNPAYDQMYDDQLAATTADARKTILAQMQNLIYDKAVYDILYYDANLEAYRTDRFAGWTKQPEANGVPLFTYSTIQYTKLTDATAVPTPAPSEAAASARRVRRPRSPRLRPSASSTPTSNGGDAGSTGPLLAGVAALVAVVAVGLVCVQPPAQRGRGSGRGRVTGSARFGGPPASLTRSIRSLTGAAG